MSFILGESTTEEFDGIDIEVDSYLKEHPLSPDENALEWWSNNEGHYPTVSKLARMYLIVPATSVPSERIFSTAGLIVNQHRNCIKADNVDMLIFLNRNLD